MGLQVARHRGALVALVHPHHALKGLEEVRHRLGVVAAAGQVADPKAVRLRFVVTGVIDLALLHQPHARHQRRRGGIAAGATPGLLRGHDCAEGGKQDRQAVALRALGPAQHVLLGDVGDFMGEDARDLVFAVGRQDQAGVHADVAAEGRERIDLALAQQEEGQWLLGAFAGAAKPGADVAQPAVQQRVVEHVARMAQLRQHHAAVLGLAGR